MDIISLSQAQLTKHAVIDRLRRNVITEGEAAEILKKSVRQVRRMKRAVLVSGIQSLIHGNTGKPPWNKRRKDVVDHIVTLYETKYTGFNCLHFQDMLQQNEGVNIPREPLRRIFLAHNLPRKKRHAKRRFERRERKPQAGMLIQQDTSIHDWFSCNMKCSLVAAIDDATNEVVYARFFPSDGTLPNMAAMKGVIETKGIPMAFYVDQASHFRTTRHESIHIQLKGTYDETQIGRALTDIGSTLILARSPQAKGRVERLFETLQDRLIKELKLANVTTIDQGNLFLVSWLPIFNKRFMVPPASAVSAYQILPNHLPLDLIFSIQENRVVRSDNTISFAGKIYLVSASKNRMSFAKATVTVHRLLMGDVRIFYKGQELAYIMSWTKSLGSEQDIIAGE
ncbi:MAG: ISNCY family transposase [Patescibacteria group bacterium]